MHDIITIQVKCPYCQATLMDEKKLIDNAPSIKLYARIGGKEGNVWLSSVYNSYNIDSEMPIKKDEVAVFSCPSCHHELTSQETCAECKAHLVDLNLLEGGKVSFCSRAGCKKHSVEFENLATAMNHFYNEFELQKHFPKDKAHPKQEEAPAKEDEVETITSGTYLNTYCPFCRLSLIEDNKVTLKIIKEDGEAGILHMSPYLNVFTHATTIKIPEHTKVKDIRCTHCDHSLIRQGKLCPSCGSELVGINVAALRKVIDFLFCSKKGCKWHGLSDEDLNYIKLDDSKEW